MSTATETIKQQLAMMQAAGKIVMQTIHHVRKSLIHGALVADLCSMGNEFAMRELGKVYPGVKKGLSFPTCVSPNAIVSNFSPTPIGSALKAAVKVDKSVDIETETKVVIESGDVVKVELGVHIDGYPVSTTQTFIVHDSQDGKAMIDDRRANVVRASKLAITRLLKQMRNTDTELKSTDATSDTTRSDTEPKFTSGEIKSSISKIVSKKTLKKKQQKTKTLGGRMMKFDIEEITEAVAKESGCAIVKDVQMTLLKRYGERSNLAYNQCIGSTQGPLEIKIDDDCIVHEFSDPQDAKDAQEYRDFEDTDDSATLATTIPVWELSVTLSTVSTTPPSQTASTTLSTRSDGATDQKDGADTTSGLELAELIERKELYPTVFCRNGEQKRKLSPDPVFATARRVVAQINRVVDGSFAFSTSSLIQTIRSDTFTHTAKSTKKSATSSSSGASVKAAAAQTASFSGTDEMVQKGLRDCLNCGLLNQYKVMSLKDSAGYVAKYKVCIAMVGGRAAPLTPLL